MFTVVTGGSASGKSAFAEDLLEHVSENKIYIATMHPYDDESIARVEKHQKMRKGKGFKTMECYIGLKTCQVPDRANVLLECMSNLAANEMFEPYGSGEHAEAEIMLGVEKLRERTENFVVVTNEISSDLGDYSPETWNYIRLLSRINRKMAELADEVVEVVYGIPIYIKKRKGEQADA